MLLSLAPSLQKELVPAFARCSWQLPSLLYATTAKAQVQKPKTSKTKREVTQPAKKPVEKPIVLVKEPIVEPVKKRAPSAFNLFVKEYRLSKKGDFKDAATDWKTLSADGKSTYLQQASEASAVLRKARDDLRAAGNSRPLNPYAVFVKENYPKVRLVASNHTDRIKLLAEQYRNLPGDEKDRLKEQYLAKKDVWLAKQGK